MVGLRRSEGLGRIGIVTDDRLHFDNAPRALDVHQQIDLAPADPDVPIEDSSPVAPEERRNEILTKAADAVPVLIPASRSTVVR